MKQRIHLGTDTWHAGNDRDCEQKAKDLRVPRFLRVIEAAKSRANIWGHAAFRPGELADWLGDKKGTPDRTTVWRAIKQAVEYGYLAPASTAECLVLNRAYYTRGRGRAEGCYEGSHAKVRYQQWHEQLGSGYGRRACRPPQRRRYLGMGSSSPRQREMSSVARRPKKFMKCAPPAPRIRLARSRSSMRGACTATTVRPSRRAAS